MVGPPRPVAVTAQEWDDSVRALLDAGRGPDALNTLQRAAAHAVGEARFRELLALLEQFPVLLRGTAEARRLRLRLLGNLPDHRQRVMAEVERQREAGEDDPFLSVFLAWVLFEEQEDRASLQHSHRAAEHAARLLPFERVLLWRTRGGALARTGQTGWQDAFDRALAEAQGRLRLLTLLELAAVQTRAGHQSAAIKTLSEAHLLARHDPLELQVAGQLGLVYQRVGEFADAERHFARLERLARRPGTRHARSRALSSLATSRRALGEWKRAEQLYEQALNAAAELQDEDDQRHALRGIGHTRRLAGRPFGALEALGQAAQVVRSERETGASWVQVDIAAVLVGLPELDEGAVEAALAASGPLSQESAERAEVVRSELARRRGDPATALAHLRPLTRDSLWLREEAHAFPELFALLPVSERPSPLPRAERLTVFLQANGCPRVTVNGREVRLPALSVVALAALLGSGGRASTDTLTDALRDGRPRSRRQAEQRVSKILSNLRRGLGWAESVQVRPRGYVLDPDTDWRYDVAEAQAQGRPVEAFLSGIDLPWVAQHGQELTLHD